ncbi:nuclear receptor subfamily 2 group E member 1 isoform X2 [Cryptotermes secundus]|uniref:nuclear receptor subfamily 2 group E member 1 isoform X2 n=1 Tax=Cryptotermes secundus TaxID=105785 RepID=UPI000CD7C2F0|nr:nuclear receptor subfamily 2 group E member 1 isoform X2 [Cryptotermes secundus]
METSSKNESLCRVCGDKASGKHYGVPSCDGCRGFFKRSIRRNLDYVCKESGHCVVDVTRRNQCQACRFNKCLQVNMKKDAVQHERAPRNPLSHHHHHHYSGARRSLYHPGAPPPGLLDLPPATAALCPGLGIQTPAPGLCSGLQHNSAAVAAAYLQQQLLTYGPTTASTATLPFAAIKQSASAFTAPLGLQFQLHSLGSPAPSPTNATDSYQQQLGRTPASSAASAKEDEVTSSEEAKAFSENDNNVEVRDACDRGYRTNEGGRLTPAPSLSRPCSLRPLDLTCLTLLPAENVYESAAKLLFLAVKWARSIPSFLQLTFRDQAILLEEAWSELFVLSAAQWALPVDEESLVNGAVAPASRHSVLEEDARRLRDTISRFVLLRVDHTEFACLKALVLFKAESHGLRNAAHVELLQDQTHVMLHEYCAARHKARFGKLLLLLPSVGSLSRQSLEELFFRKTVGDVPIERLLGDMVKSSSG